MRRSPLSPPAHATRKAQGHRPRDWHSRREDANIHSLPGPKAPAQLRRTTTRLHAMPHPLGCLLIAALQRDFIPKKHCELSAITDTCSRASATQPNSTPPPMKPTEPHGHPRAQHPGKPPPGAAARCDSTCFRPGASRCRGNHPGTRATRIFYHLHSSASPLSSSPHTFVGMASSNPP